jgi:hypothetical protein
LVPVMSNRKRLLAGSVVLLLIGSLLVAPGVPASALPAGSGSSPADGHPVLTPIERPLVEAEWYEPGIALPEEYRTAYQDAEYFLDGFARSYPDPIGERVPYRTRIFVRTPKDPSAFSGTVIVEFLNPTLDQSPTYVEAWQEIHRENHAYVAVSGHASGVEFLKQRNPVRYGSLAHPGNDFAYDMFSQAGWVLKNPGAHDALVGLRERPRHLPASPLSPLGGIHPRPEMVDIKLIGTGMSGSGSGLTQYIVRGALRDAAAAGVYAALMPVDSGGPVTLYSPTSPGDEYAVPILHPMAESQWRPNAPEHPLYKRWFVAGGSHRSQWSLSGAPGLAVVMSGADELPVPVSELARQDGQYGELGGVGIRTGLPPTGVVIPLPAECMPLNMFPRRYAINAAIRGLDAWIRNGTPVANSPDFLHDESGLLRDGDGNVLGGLRLAPIEVPVAAYDGESCDPWGFTRPFSDEELRSRYPTHGDYMEQLAAAADVDLIQGHLLAEDRDDLLERARAAAFRWVTSI